MTTAGRVLHLLSQRPGRTGSGVTLDALVREAARHGWEQSALVGVPVDDAQPSVGALPTDHVHTVTFRSAESPEASADLDFLIPGMSDVMPYPSSRFAALTAAQVEDYRAVWRDRLAAMVARFAPDVIHGHHAWLVSALVHDVAPDVPLVIHGHGTGLRQMELCPHLVEGVRAGCSNASGLAVLHDDHRTQYARALGLPASRVHQVGAGYREDVFHARDRRSGPGTTVAYAGKLSHAKGLGSLLDAIELVRRDEPAIRLVVAGGGAGEEADALRERIATMGHEVELVGAVEQPVLARILRDAAVFVLPSFYEGLPLVLVEAAACGCRAVSTDLPGVRAGLADALGDWLELVPAPRLEGVDTPRAEDLPGFAEDLATAIRRALAAPELDATTAEASQRLAPFTWRAVFERVESIWRDVTRPA